MLFCKYFNYETFRHSTERKALVSSRVPDCSYFFDYSHLIKFVRNYFSTYRKLYKNNQCTCISWKYIEKLHCLQEAEGLKIANRLTSKHVLQWRRHQMRVGIVVQTLSASVANAITFLEDCKLPDSSDSAATTEFLFTVNRIFDILNSRSPA